MLINIFRKANYLKNLRFFFSTNEVQTKQPEQEVPVHLRPYNKLKFEVPSEKLKYATGYALLDVEPMPRAKIMKLCYNILDKLKDIPETAMYRIYTEEKVKYIMKMTDEIDDIRKLEEEFGHETIELFIVALNKEFGLVDYMKDSKPWEVREEDLETIKIGKIKRDDFKHMKTERPQREQTKFIE